MNPYCRVMFSGMLVAVLLPVPGPLSAQNAPVKLNEAMTSNLTSLHDEYEPGRDNCRVRDCDAYYEELSEKPFATYDGIYPDWIELYNPGDTVFALDGYGISDDPAEPFKWVFPNYQIPPRGYFVVFATGKDRKPISPKLAIWETIITQGDEWRYAIGTVEPPPGWRSPDFDDSSWPVGPSGFGYGDNDDATELPVETLSVYLRKTFAIESMDNIVACVLSMDYDDGFVAYLNEKKIAIAGLGWTGAPPPHDARAAAGTEPRLPSGAQPDTFVVADFSSLLVEGQNVLAVQVHNVLPNSPDLTAMPFLTLGLAERPARPRGLEPAIQSSFLGEAEEPLYPHTNFKLGRRGETLVLTDPGGTTVDRLEVGELPPDFTYGRQPDGADNLVVFHDPTPEAANTTPPFPGFLDEPLTVFPPGGFHSGSASVEISAASPQAEIHYTLDGAEPTPRSSQYTGPITITRSTAVRARAFRKGIPSSRMVTQSYLINYETTMPVVAITTAPDNLWSGDTGIYVLGNHGTRHLSNLWKGWERPCHVELYEADGALGFSQEAGVRLHGRGTKFLPRKSLAVMARDRYGKDTFDYPLIPELPIPEYASFILRNGGNDWQGALFRDLLCNDLVKHLNMDVMAGRPAVVFLNGEYWGILPIREKENEEYLASHHNVDPDNIDVMELYHLVPPPVGLEGTEENYLALLEYLETHDVREPAVYEQVGNRIDMDSYLDHHVAGVYYTNADWLGNNYKCWRDRGPDGRWRWLMFDLDFGFNGWSHDHTYNMIYFITNPTGPKSQYPSWTNFIIRTLLTNEEFRTDYLNRLADHLNTVYKPERVLQRIEEMRAQFEPEMARHIDRWKNDGELKSMRRWDQEIASMRDFARRRPPVARQHVVDHWDLDGLAALTVSVSDPAAGMVRVNTVVPEAYPWQGTYFKDIPVQISAVPNPGYAFDGWEGLEAVAKAAGYTSMLHLALPDTLVLTAHFKPISGALNRVVINEINYNSADDFNTGDWLEIYNESETPIDVSAWRLRDDNDARSFVLPVHTVIEPYGYLVLCETPSAFTALFPDVASQVGGFAFGFGAGGDAVRLFDSADRLADAVLYDDEPPWPTGPDGTGATLALRRPGLDNQQPESWAASGGHGTPGEQNDVYTVIRADDAAPTPQLFSVGQSYPNPFNAVATIPLALPWDSHVHIEVYSVLGQRIAVAIDEPLPAGPHTVALRPRNLASGMYIYTLRVGSHIRGGQMLYLK